MPRLWVLTFIQVSSHRLPKYFYNDRDHCGRPSWYAWKKLATKQTDSKWRSDRPNTDMFNPANPVPGMPAGAPRRGLGAS